MASGRGGGRPRNPPASGDALPPATAPTRFSSTEVGRILFAMAGTMSAARFVGRTAELERLQAAYEAARSGDPVTLVAGGEAGVGKTRLVTQFGAQARESGARVLLGGCIDVGD